MSVEKLREEHLRRQNSASNPMHSVWVSANAGAGKTHILVERIIRLLLPPYNCQPHKILCITYTKAAASEMTERLFKRLGSWIAKSDSELIAEMTNIMGHAPSDEDVIIARRLFARALETPGGLKIQTIHAFCEHILRRFPIEAGFRKDFTLLSDAALKKLYTEAVDYLASYAMQNPASSLGEAFKEISQYYSLQTVIELLINSRKTYHTVTSQGFPFWDADRLADHLGLPFECNLSEIYDAFFEAVDDVEIARVISALEQGGAQDQQKAEILKHISIKDLLDIDLWQSLFLTKEQKLCARGRFISKAIQENYTQQADYLYKLFDLFTEAYNQHNALLIYQITKQMSLILIASYEYVTNIKTEQGLCDFDDIILKAKELLDNIEVAPWVLWKLDGGIDHILVDEAQDTAPEQWDIIRALSQEFFVGEGANPKHRTIFAVGDEKQSIYGFQGAAPEKMSQNASFFQQASIDGQKKWTIEYLRGSFRSSPAIMKLVDSVFQKEATSGILFGDAQKVEHYAVANPGPGYIEVLPPAIPQESGMLDAWTDPLDKPSSASAEVINAKKIAKKIQEILQSSDLLPSTGRPPEPKDIMILLQSRGSIMRGLIRELKALKIPVSGLDRIDLLSEIAILDLLALIDFVLYPDDDLTLAQILRSPLCPFLEEDLFELAHNRTGTLWYALVLRHQENEIFGQAYNFLQAVLKHVDYESPYEFLSFVLENCQGRKKFIARLGADCIDGLDELLNKALDFVNEHTPSLQNFVQFMRLSGGNQKREIDTSDNAVQIMTVHGAKGLEAPIVFLPNCCDLPQANKDLYKRFIVTADHIPLILKEGGKHQTAIDHKEFFKKRDQDENRRLLYVAMTRAKDWLFISGKLKKAKSDKHKIPEESWYDYITKGLLSLEGTQIIAQEDTPFSSYIYQDLQTHKIEYNSKATDHEISHPPELPEWAHKLPQKLLSVDHFIAPSHVQNQTDSVHDIVARKRGIIIHKLLELLVHIKPQDRQKLAETHLKNYQLAPEIQETYLDEVFTLLEHPEFIHLFNQDGLSEVPIIGHIASLGNIPISGQIDRMMITDTQIMIIDYKTSKNMDYIPQAYKMQMALYWAALKEMYPHKKVTCYIIATAYPKIIEIAESDLENALEGLRIRHQKKLMASR